MRTFFATLMRNQRAATAVEYGLIAALISLAAFGAITTFGAKATAMWNNTATAVENNT
ncbi:MAG: Flp family type IVb pilin [Pseudomonadota bacterium]